MQKPSHLAQSRTYGQLVGVLRSTEMDPQPEGPATSISVLAYLRLLRENRNFRRLWLAQIISEVGDWFYSLAIYSLLLQLTGRAGSVALALVLQCRPQPLV